jgi:hypothetical protein
LEPNEYEVVGVVWDYESGRIVHVFSDYKVKDGDEKPACRTLKFSNDADKPSTFCLFCPCALFTDTLEVLVWLELSGYAHFVDCASWKQQVVKGSLLELRPWVSSNH